MNTRRPLLVILLGLVLYIIIGIQAYSASGFWERYKPWFGEPVEVEYCHEFNGNDCFYLRLSKDQRQQWADTFQLVKKAENANDFSPSISSKHPVTLKGADKEMTFDIRLERNYESEDQDSYILTLERIYPEFLDSAELASFTPIVVENRSEIASFHLRRDLIPILFIACILLVPALMARLIVKKREGCFAFKELFLNYLTSLLIYGIFNFIFLISLYIFGSFAPDTPFFMMVGGIAAGPFICAFACLGLYLIIGTYRWVKQRKQSA